jgi:TrpR family transcriptional regulator, trp operon repressor
MFEFDDFIETVHSIKDKALLKDFLLSMTTPMERRQFWRRLAIVKMLIEGVPQAKIAKDLGVGIATVTRVSKELAQDHFKALRKKP